MSRYKVSYKVLRQQGEDMKAVAKLIDGYADSVSKIRGRLGSDNMLAGIRDNLQKLGAELGESRAVLNTAGELLIKNVEGYGGAEVRQVKKVGGMRSHNRDFYKNPVVVASAGGAAGGIAAAGAAGATAPAATTMNYTDNSVNVTYAAPESAASATAPVAAQLSEVKASQASPLQSQPPASAQSVTGNAQAEPSSTGMSSAAKIATGAGAAGAVAAGAVLGGREIKKRRGVESTNVVSDPETELEQARHRLSEILEESPAEPT